jgi:hypothetical protein
MDQDLVVRVQQGDQRAFEALAAADYDRLYRVAYGVMGDHPSAEDVTQQALLDIWRDIRRLREPAKYEAWAYRLLVRVCYAEAKRRPKWRSSDDLPPAAEPRAVDAYRTQGPALDHDGRVVCGPSPARSPAPFALIVHWPPPPRGSGRKHDPRTSDVPPVRYTTRGETRGRRGLSSTAAPWVTMGRTRRAGQYRRGAADRSSTSPDLTGAPGRVLAGCVRRARSGSGRSRTPRPPRERKDGGVRPRATGAWISARSAMVSRFDVSSPSAPDRRPR